MKIKKTSKLINTTMIFYIFLIIKNNLKIITMKVERTQII